VLLGSTKVRSSPSVSAASRPRQKVAEVARVAVAVERDLDRGVPRPLHDRQTEWSTRSFGADEHAAAPREVGAE